MQLSVAMAGTGFWRSCAGTPGRFASRWWRFHVPGSRILGEGASLPDFMAGCP